MYDSFLGFINEHRLVEPADRVLLAVSGGLDSVVMAHLFARAGFTFGIAHVNFGLRGAESDADEALVHSLAQQLNVSFHTVRFDTERIASERTQSIQVAARELRYNWFATLAQKEGYTRIATAHHQNDVLETLLLNLVRGTGLAGLRSIPIRQGAIIRPLWALSRFDLKDYAVEQGLVWRHDLSNDTDKYSRNKIRHHVVPVLEKLNPNLLHTLGQTLERLRAADSLVSKAVEAGWAAAVTETGGIWTINREKLLMLSEWAFLLSEWLKRFGFSYVQSQAIARSVESEKTGQVFRSATHAIWHDREGLAITPVDIDAFFCYPLPLLPAKAVTLPDGRRLLFRLYDRPAHFEPSADPSVAQLDADRLTEPLLVRRWQPGDRLRPLNLVGHKLVSDLLNDRKVSLPERARTAVLVANGEIAWVVGHRIAHGVRIRENTTRILECRLVEAPATH